MPFNGKDRQSIVGYQIDEETIILLFIKTPENIFSYRVSQYEKGSPYTISFNVSGDPEWMFYYRNIWSGVQSQLFEKMTAELT